MARVYLARDAKHARNVAVKVIRPDVAASLGRDRFLREIGIAARLRHPNIVPLYDSGDADGVLYFVMPYEEGPSLGARLRDGPLPVGECVSVLRDVARALAYAHEHGVVHRDVKPDNVMLSGGAAIVTDFGIAKAIAAAAGGDRPERDGDLLATAITQLGCRAGKRQRTWLLNRRWVTRPQIIVRTSTRSAASPTSCSRGSRRFTVCRRTRSSRPTSGRCPFRCPEVSAAVPDSARGSSRDLSREGPGSLDRKALMSCSPLSRVPKPA
jgi:serine/threonine protein kinase